MSLKISMNKIVSKMALKAGILLFSTVRISNATSCFDSQRLPKMIQTNANMEDNQAEAIISFDYASGSALFTGGYINQAAWLDAGESYTAHVGRINTSSRSWVWSKQFTDPTFQKLSTVTALAIDPSGT